MRKKEGGYTQISTRVEYLTIESRHQASELGKLEEQLYKLVGEYLESAEEKSLCKFALFVLTKNQEVK